MTLPEILVTKPAGESETEKPFANTPREIPTFSKQKQGVFFKSGWTEGVQIFPPRQFFSGFLLDQSRGEGEVHVTDRHFKSFSLAGHHLDDIEAGDLAVGAF
jgi:hypothetical protein